MSLKVIQEAALIAIQAAWLWVVEHDTVVTFCCVLSCKDVIFVSEHDTFEPLN